ncbi:tetratricopeptide repeat protein [Pseudoroseomonas ludipueritiae]|uniref:Sel1 repeat family protein n=1 Tax=Pseudoroseomonas ludipueritiae TaxID=198093 RepID=A0ABR7R1Z3_9PROT|nr:tetratricopeptide repeat protein [Pseudoroseomonas ludipueritiae]MBC9175709.1 sel1 repeat family protein [Pseudoroseomonas ludipueritiae]
MALFDLFRRRAAPPPPDPMELALAAFQRGDYAEALNLWEPLARAGDARAQSNIGACFAEGMGVERNPALALTWLTLAAEAGYPAGQRNLAALYLQGGGDAVEADPAHAAALYRQAAEQGDAQAQDMLSWMLLEGEVIPSDPEEAHRWALAAAEAGIASSMTRMGMLYHHALGVERDVAEAARWWRRGAGHGDADGQAMLGAAYVLGAGVEADPVTALAWLLRAQAGGSGLAQPFLGPARARLDDAGRAEAARRAALPLEEEGA